MAEVQNKTANATPHTKKRKGFWSSIFNRSSDADENKAEKADPKRKGVMDSLMTNVGRATTKLAEEEAKKEIEAKLNDSTNSNGGTQPSDTDTTDSGQDGALSTSANWAKRMVDSAQQKAQSLQQSLTS